MRMAAFATLSLLLASAGSDAAPDVSPPEAEPFTRSDDGASPLSSPPASAANEIVSEERRVLALAIEKWRARPAASTDAARLREGVAAFYEARGFEPLWREGDAWRPEAGALAERLRKADEDGLDLRAYAIPGMANGPASAEAELLLSQAIAAYAAQASGARIDPQKLSRLIGARPTAPKPAAVLEAVAAGGANVLQAYNPPHAGYLALKAKLIEIRRARGASVRLAGAVPAFTREGAFPAPKAKRRRLLEDGRRARLLEAEIIANMERWRWMPRDLGDAHVEINIPSFELTVLRNGLAAHRARVIVGKQATPTPIFSNELRYVIVNPYWNVPPSILNKEMLPRYGGDLSALTRSGFQAVYRKGRLTVRQRPGERNALGRIKFMFPNEFSVYLHDTPSRGLFGQVRRAFSHGCVRVDEPFRLAETVLGPSWPQARVKKLIGGSERYINLAAPLPIHIEYFTAYVDEKGRLQLRDDIYGYSARVRAALGLEG